MTLMRTWSVDWLPQDPNPIMLARLLGGRGGWVIPVDTTGVRSLGQPDAVLESITFNPMETERKGDDVMVDVMVDIFHYETQALGVLNYPVLQYPCTLIDPGEGRLKKI
ncbi:hypothetical protein SLS59_004579 [Nothophoma quercina]|uniref:Uncharacterized protein n=1 Tax=Nothophoma quercina TaxID=749835 RepID=A0ABR3RFL2_9PLEO